MHAGADAEEEFEKALESAHREGHSSVGLSEHHHQTETERLMIRHTERRTEFKSPSQMDMLHASTDTGAMENSGSLLNAPGSAPAPFAIGSYDSRASIDSGVTSMGLNDMKQDDESHTSEMEAEDGDILSEKHPALATVLELRLLEDFTRLEKTRCQANQGQNNLY